MAHFLAQRDPKGFCFLCRQRVANSYKIVRTSTFSFAFAGNLLPRPVSRQPQDERISAGQDTSGGISTIQGRMDPPSRDKLLHMEKNPCLAGSRTGVLSAQCGLIYKIRNSPVTDQFMPVQRTASAFEPRLAAIFPNGVCDYSKPGVEQQIPRGTWLSH